ncbi:hypothetical protein U5B43_01325 [Campylobacter sp. 9BO]|uniref:hypothetical protein n=1 Tax=Campylobacter sp. 9BO TaxID=3424759 RepID=UPI003D33E377
MANELAKTEQSLSDHIKNNTVVQYWQDEADFDKLALTTVETMRFINEEQIREFAQNLQKNNEQILSMTFEGVKKRHEKELDELVKKQKKTSAIAFVLGAVTCTIGFIIGMLIMGKI